MLNKRVKKFVGSIVLFSQMFSALTPILTFAAPQGVSGGDIQNALESVGTKANRLKTIGLSGVDESTGAFTYSYPFAIPKGLSGLEPAIVLSYNSQNTENTFVGYGWNLAIPYIERTAKYGVDKIYTKNDFVSSLGCELMQKSGTTNQYIQKIDDGSYQLYTLSNNIWTLSDRSGNIYTFGTTLDSRLADSTNTKIQKYYLTEVKDILGNKVKYFYEKKNGLVYPKEIIYTVKKDGTYSNKIIFEREERADKDVSYKSGFRTELIDRVKTIRAFTDNTEVAKLEIGYVTGQNGTRSLPSTVKESRVGTDGMWSTIPETKFEYEKTSITERNASISIQSGQGYQDISGDAKPEYYPLTEGVVNGASWKVIDYNGDYRPDMFYHLQNQTYCNGYCGSYWLPAEGSIRLGNENGNFTSLPISTVSAANFPFTSDYHWLYRGVDNNSVITDVNGDGLQDIIGSKVSINNGNSGFTTTNYNQSGYKYIIDVNGDSLPDKIVDKQVFLNNGIGWETASDTKYIVPVTSELTDTNGTKYDTGFRFTDVNGDNLVDVVRSYSFTSTWVYCYTRSNFCNQSLSEVYTNNGNGWVLNTNLKVTKPIVVYTMDMNSYLWSATTQNDFSEINSDGSLVIAKQDILKTVISPLGSKSEIIYKGSVSGNNPKLPINILTVSEIKNTEVNKNISESVKYTYENGKMYFDKNNVYDRRFAGFEKVTTETGNGNVIKKAVKYFHQGDGDNVVTFERGDSFHNIGRVYKEEVFAGNNSSMTKYAETYRTYGVYNWDGQIYKYPKLEVSTEFDKNGSSFSKAVTYDYDLAARLPKKTESFGEVKWDITTGTFSDIGEDYVLTKNIYNTKRPQKLLAEESFDINGKFLDKKINFYDELPFGYVEKGLLSEERNYSNANNYVKNSYTYNSLGLVETKTENNGAVTKYVYDAAYNPTSVTNALNQTTTFETNKFLGVQTKQIDANGKITETVYDGFANVKSISQTSPKDDNVKLVATKNISYTVHGMTETESVYEGGVIYKTSTKNYDSFGRLIKSQSTNTENSNQTIDIKYNNLGQLEKVTYPYDSQNILSGYFSQYDTKYFYDELGRNVEVVQGDLKNFTSYFVNGKSTSDNSPDQHKKEYKYNSLGKLASVKEFTNSENFLETKYEWNLLGNLTKLTDSLNNVRNFFYDSEGRLLKQEDLHSHSDNTFGVYTYSYDANGNLTSKKDPSENVATFEYDLLNRPKRESFGNITTYIYDTCQNGIGKMCEVENSDYSQVLEYNKSGNILSETKNIKDKNGDKVFTNIYSYNDIGQNLTITLPDNSVIAYSYDLNGKQKTVKLMRMINNLASTTEIVADAKYNIDGTIKNITQGNNVKTCYEYSGVNGGNVLPRLSKLSVVNSADCNTTESGKLLFSQDLKYNLFGSIVENKEIIVDEEILNKYTYDTLQRLTKSERQEGSINAFNELTYNSIGNILSSDSTQYSYDGSDYKNPHTPSIIGNTVMTYDLNGNILSDQKNQYEWNLKNTLAKVVNDKSITEYIYDVGGERIKEVAKVKLSNSTSTFAMNSGTENYVGEEVFTDFGSLGTSTSPNIFISQIAYNEIKNILNVATITKTDINNFISPIYTSKFINETCSTIISSQREICERDNILKVIFTKTKKEKNIEISYGTLEEMWLVYKGKLKVNWEIYEPKEIEKVLDFADAGNNVKMYFAQQNNISDYFGQPYCYIYEYANNNYVCNIVFNKDIIKNYSDYSIDTAEIFVSSHYSWPASTTKFAELLNINLESNPKFATSSNSNSAFASSIGYLAGYPRYKTDITNIAKSWSISTSSLVGFSIRNEPKTFTGYFGNIIAPYSGFSNDMKPKIIVKYKFTGEIKKYNSITTKIFASDNIDSFYNSYITNTKAQELAKDNVPYISENSYNELKTNKLNSQNKVEMLFALALEGNKYVKDICKQSIEKDCQKKESIKFVASYLYNKHNIKLYANTLEEMYQMYSGDLKLSNSDGIYERVVVGNLLSDKSGSSCTMNFYQYRNDYVNNQCNLYYYFFEMYNSTKGKFDFDPDKKEAFLEIETEAEVGKNFLPFTYSLGTKVVNFDKPGKYVIDFSNEWRAQIKSNTYIWSNYWDLRPQAQFTVNDASNQTKGTVIKKMRIYAGEYEYINKNINKNILATNQTMNTQDKILLGYIYKQKKINSLFGSDKLISKESFAELSLLSFTYSDLIIKDMLVDVSFTPYTKCEEINDDLQKRNCRKEIFVKYLFAIIKYETDKEISAIALDELFEVAEGNLSMPNNLEDYKIRNSQTFTLSSSENTHVLSGYYSYAVDSDQQYRVGCQSGFSRPGQLSLDNVCDISFPVPTELDARKNEIESATISLLASQGRGDYYSPNTFNPGQVYFAPVISNNPFSYSSGQIPASALYAWNTNQNFVSSTENLKLGQVTEVNITNIVQGIVKGELNNFGLRIISNGNNINYQNGGKYQLNVKFAKDAPQNLSAYITPMVTNPKDSAVYEDVLKVLARVDREYKTTSDTIISKETYEEIKNSGATSTELIKNIFSQNEKLQKDDTLAAIYEYFKLQKNLELTREALEELWMLNNEKLIFPANENIYATTSTSTIFFSRASLENLSIVPGVKSVRQISDDNIYFTRKMVSVEGVKELKSVGIEKRGDILKYTIFSTSLISTSTISQIVKINILKNIYIEVASSTNIKLSREALEEIYYIFNNKLVLSSVDLLSPTEKLEVAKRSDFGMLEPIGGVNSLNQEKLENNIEYKITQAEIKIVSKDTHGELKLAGINSREQIVDIIKKTKTVYKDSKINFFFNYVKENLKYEFSREALEEIYLIYTEQAIFPVTATLKTEKEIINVVNKKNPGCNLYMNSCEFEFEIKNKPGYNLISSNFLFTGQFIAGGYSNYPVYLEIDGKKITISSVIKSSSLISVNYNQKYSGKLYISGFDVGSLVGLSANVGEPKLELVYEPITGINERENFGELSQISTFEKLSESYTKEVESDNFGISSKLATTSLKIISNETLLELEKVGLNTNQKIKDAINILPTNYSKLSKLYALYLKYKTEKNIELSRLALEEIWEVYIGNVIIKDGLLKVDPAKITADILKEKLVISDKYNGLASTYYAGYPYIQGSGYCGVFGYYESDCLIKFGGLKNKDDYVLEKAEVKFNYYSNNYGTFDVQIGIPKQNYTLNSYQNTQIETDNNSVKFTVNNSYGTQPVQVKDITTLIKKSLDNPTKTNFDLAFKKYNNDYRSWQQIFFSTPYDGWWGIYGVKSPEIELTWKKKIIDPYQGLLTNNRSDYQEQVMINNFAKLEEKYNQDAGPVEEEILVENSTTTELISEIISTETSTTTEEVLALEENISTNPVSEATNSNQPNSETLALLNPYSYAFTSISPSEIELQINGQIYTVNLDNYVQFYQDLDLKNVDTLAKYLNQLSETQEEIIYTKFYPSQFYELDSRGYVTINVPFNGKVVATIKYSTNNSNQLTETSYISNNYLGSAVLLTDSQASTTQIIQSDAWGVQVKNDYNPNIQTPTTQGFTGHKWDENSGLTYAHARYMLNTNKVFLSHDPYSINNFTNGTWLMNPQIQNSYSYASNNPVNMVDPDGQKPTPEEAARMSAQIYMNGYEGANLSGGWSYNYAMYGGDNLKMGVYSRNVDGKTEYTIAYRGTTKSWSDVKNDIQQPFGWSADAKAAMSQAGKVMDELGNAEVTFTGHSEGGAYAQLSGVRYGQNVMTFNSARPFYGQYGLTLEVIMYANGSKKIEPYRVDGEILGIFNNVFFGAYAMPMGGNIPLPSQGLYNVTAPSIPGITSNKTTAPVTNSFRTPFQNSYNDHSSKSVLYGVTTKSW